VSDEQFLTSPFLPRFHLFSHKLKLKSVKKGLQNPQDRPPSYGLRLQSYQFDIEQLPGARMPADFLSRIVDKADSTAPDLEDDSNLVFALTSDGVSQQDTAQIVRPSGNPGRKRRTCRLIITLTNYHDPDRQEHTDDRQFIALFVATKPVS